LKGDKKTGTRGEVLGLRRVLIFNKEMAEQVKHFTDLKVWRKAHELFLGVLKDVEKFPRIKGAGVVADQIIRSVGSIGANIAEGFNSRTRKQYINFLDIARRSGAESENWYYKIRDAGFLDNETANIRIATCIEISKMLQSLMKSLSTIEEE